MLLDDMQKSSTFRDIISIGLFVLIVIVGTLAINAFIFRSFSVTGPSMEDTLFTGDRLIVNRLPVSLQQLQGKQYQPKRGDIIVFKNPLFEATAESEYIVKRVIGLPSERVTVAGGDVRVFNEQFPNGFNPDNAYEGAGSPTSGDVNKTVPPGEIFVMGDHREGDFSLDSRNGLSTVALDNVIGPVSVRIFPFGDIHFF